MMSRRILILGASYGSLLGTKLAMAGHDVVLVCRAATAAVINQQGTEVRIKLRDEPDRRAIRSGDLPGTISATAPDGVDLSGIDLVALAMQEPQYGAPEIRALMRRIADAGLPCLSIMNMPPLPYLSRIPGLDPARLTDAYGDARVWDRFAPGKISLCSPDPQAFRPPDAAPNVLHVGLPTNFKAAGFGDPADTALLADLADDIAAIRLEGKDVPVKLRLHSSLFVPLAKWSMLLTGNYRCITEGAALPIRDAVHGDPAASRAIYTHVDAIARALGADPADQVPYEKYAAAAENLGKPSSAARAIDAGARAIERVDRLVQLIARDLGMAHPEIDRVVALVDTRLARNRSA